MFVCFLLCQDVEKTKSLDAFEADRSIVELKEEIGHGEFGRYDSEVEIVQYCYGVYLNRVMKASAKGVLPGQLKSTVAVKMLKGTYIRTYTKSLAVLWLDLIVWGRG